MSICIWNLGTECDGVIKTHLMFGGTLEISACEKHYTDHVKIMAYYNISGKPVEEIINMPMHKISEKINENVATITKLVDQGHFKPDTLEVLGISKKRPTGPNKYFKITKAKKPKDKVWIRISKKVSKKAVERNKLRRQVREMIKKSPRDLSMYIISVKPAAKDKSFKTLKSYLIREIYTKVRKY